LNPELPACNPPVYRLRCPSSLLYKNVKIEIYTTVILSVLLYGCRTWCLAIHFRVLGRMLEPKRNEVLRDFRKLCNEEFGKLYTSPNIIKIIESRRRWSGRLAWMGGRRMDMVLW
jgi:hypothetical protein